MHNLANLLQTGAFGVEKDVERAVMLYERAIEEGSDVGSMCNLANLLRMGVAGVEEDAERTIHVLSNF